MSSETDSSSSSRPLRERVSRLAGTSRSAEAAPASGAGSARPASRVQRAAQRVRRQKQKTQTREGETQTGGRQKLEGLGFFVILSLAILNDFTDLLATATMVLYVVSIITTFITKLIIFSYYFYHGVTLSTRKLVLWVVTTITSLFTPLPTTIANVVLTRIMYNNELIRSATAAVAPGGRIRRVARRKLRHST